MTQASEPATRGGARFPLAAKLGLAIAVVAVLLLVFLLAYFGPRTSRTFLARCNELAARGVGAMAELAREDTAGSKDVLIGLIRHTADARKRALEDLPLSLYGGDLGRIRAAIEDEDTFRCRRLEHNVDLLAREMERRSTRRIERHAVRLTAEQAARGAVFAGDVRRSYLVLCGALVAASLAVLGGGLWRFVVRPVRSLQRATRAVTRGDLGVDVDISSSDEIGVLAADFATMVSQLRASRAELTELNRSLESEVARQTGHLERTLDDLRRAQGKLVLAEKMASLGTLAGGVAHEFNNLIGGIQGCAAEALRDEEDPDRREPLEVILRAASRGADITRDLMRFAKLRVVAMADVDVARVLDEAVRLVEDDARRLAVRVVRRYASGSTIEGDAAALAQVFLNLFRNAVQAMPGGGTLTIRAGAGEGKLVVRVADTGQGIPADRIGRIFDPFFTTKGSATEPFFRGSGLGLSVSYGIVGAHGGTIEVRSSPGEGSVFTVTLPLRQRERG